MAAQPEQDRRDPAVEPLLQDGEQESAFDPSRCRGVGSENDHQPIAAVQRRPDLVMPLPSDQDVGVAVPHGNAVVADYLGKPGRERPVGTRVGQEDFAGNGRRRFRGGPSGVTEYRRRDHLDSWGLGLGVIQFVPRLAPHDPRKLGGWIPVNVPDDNRNQPVAVDFRSERVLDVALNVGASWWLPE